MLSKADARAVGSLLAQGFQPDLIRAAYPSFSERLAEQVDLFKRSAKSEVVMRTARRCRLPYSAVRDGVPAFRVRWSDEDLVAEVAWDVIQAEIAARICPNCGTDPHDILTEARDLAEDPPMKMTVEGCHGCVVERKANDSISEDGRKQWGLHAKWAPRGPGERLEDF